LVAFILVFVLTFYMTVEEQATKRLVRSLVPLKHQPYLTNLMNRMQDKIGLWLRGQLILSLVIFVLVWIGLTILGVKYAVVLALLAGVMEIVPYLGPIISAIPAVFIAFTQYPMLAVGVLILYYLIQFAENHILVPQVMRRTVGLNPVITIVALLVGAKIAGILGIALAVPVTTAIGVAVGDFLDINKKAVEEDEDIESA
ncbi:MAG: AI-2E family transporter, partial [bacterium]